MAENKILFVNSLFGFFGGVERYIFNVARLLNENGWDCFGFFEGSSDKSQGFEEPFKTMSIRSSAQNGETGKNAASDYEYLDRCAQLGVKVAFVHKIGSAALFEELQKRFKVITFIHDHDYYCIRRHKYFPITRKNCSLCYNLIRCGLCSGLVRKDANSPLKLKFIELNKFLRLFNAL